MVHQEGLEASTYRMRLLRHTVRFSGYGERVLDGEFPEQLVGSDWRSTGELAA